MLLNYAVKLNTSTNRLSLLSEGITLNKMENKGLIVVGIQLAFIAVILIGEVKCIVKAVKCNWEPIGKAEVIYTAAAFTGTGAIVGWIDIEDN